MGEYPSLKGIIDSIIFLLLVQEHEPSFPPTFAPTVAIYCPYQRPKPVRSLDVGLEPSEK